jgi:hypothetical protein
MTFSVTDEKWILVDMNNFPYDGNQESCENTRAYFFCVSKPGWFNVIIDVPAYQSVSQFIEIQELS